MTEERELSVEEAQRILAEDEQNRRQEFSQRLEELLEEYGYSLTARFELFSTTVNPPIRIVNRQQ